MARENYYGSESEFAAFVAGSTASGLLPCGPGYRLVKRLFDVVASGCGLLLILPLFPFIVLLIKLETRGPIFFRQTRVGLRGRLFRCYKFRSMAVDAEARKEELT